MTVSESGEISVAPHCFAMTNYLPRERRAHHTVANYLFDPLVKAFIEAEVNRGAVPVVVVLGFADSSLLLPVTGTNPHLLDSEAS